MPEMICLKHTEGVEFAECEACWNRNTDDEHAGHLFIKECQNDYLATLKEAIVLWRKEEQLRSKIRASFVEMPSSTSGQGLMGS